jgi:hypothetical protein
MRPRTWASGGYGIAEWYGQNYRALDNHARKCFSAGGRRICRFLADNPALAPGGQTMCNKKGGVCSLRNFINHGGDNNSRLTFGPITATCPNRFLEDQLIFKIIGRNILTCNTPRIVKEIPFLKRIIPRDPAIEAGLLVGSESAPNQVEGEIIGPPDQEDVGRIDMVCVHPDDYKQWCAVELQAVYFSGAAMTRDFLAIRDYAGDGIPLPGGRRRPDFRSSGPKRLMPQLQIKVPTLRRWGKKMAVVVDRPFFDALGEMDAVTHISNADIIWIIMKYIEDESRDIAKIDLDDIKFTTLERAVEGLTAGVPTTKDEFEKKIVEKLRAN